jgi:type IV pilus assembly protein PilA
MKKETKIKNKKGFTLPEIATSIAVLGIITAIAVPNYVRIKMEVNAEHVRGNLKVIHKALNDFLSRTGGFPDDFTSLPIGSDEELAVSANLTAIDIKNYEFTYQLSNELGFRLSTQPKDPALRIANYCFQTDSLGVRRVGCGNPWDGSAVAMSPETFLSAFEFLETLLFDPALQDPPLAEDAIVAIIAGFLEEQALTNVLNRETAEEIAEWSPDYEAASLAMHELMIKATETTRSVRNSKQRTAMMTEFYSSEEYLSTVKRLDEASKLYMVNRELKHDGLSEWRKRADKGLPSTLVSMSEQVREKITDLMPKIYEALQEQDISVKVRTGMSMSAWQQDVEKRDVKKGERQSYVQGGMQEKYEAYSKARNDPEYLEERTARLAIEQNASSLQFSFDVTKRPENLDRAMIQLQSSDHYQLYRSYSTAIKEYAYLDRHQNTVNETKESLATATNRRVKRSLAKNLIRYEQWVVDQQKAYDQAKTELYAYASDITG